MPDEKTHMIFAKYLLKSCGEVREDFAFFSTLPMIDSEPSYYHRLYYHSFFRMPNLIGLGFNFFGINSAPANELDRYGFERLRAERDDLLSTIISFLGREPEICYDPKPALLAALSHIYLDCFNNPVQAFLPILPYCSGAWEFYQKVDMFHNRDKLYGNKDSIAIFHAAFEEALRYEERFDLDSIIYALIYETGEAMISPKHVDIEWLSQYVLKDYEASLGLSFDIGEPVPIWQKVESAMELAVKRALEK